MFFKEAVGQPQLVIVFRVTAKQFSSTLDFRKMKIENWIDDRNLIPVATAICWLCNYKFDDWDRDAIEEGARDSDETKNKWYEYEFNGNYKIKFAVTIEPGSSNYSIRVESEENIEQAVNSILGLGQCYELREFE